MSAIRKAHFINGILAVLVGIVAGLAGIATLLGYHPDLAIGEWRHMAAVAQVGVAVYSVPAAGYWYRKWTGKTVKTVPVPEVER